MNHEIDAMEEAARVELAGVLMQKSYKEGHFILASGRESDYYFDCRTTSLSARGSWLIGTIFDSIIHSYNRTNMEDINIVGVAGMTMGADPLVTSTSLISTLNNRPLDALIVRKQAKDHGTTQWVEGLANFKTGDTVAVLEDVVTTGGSLLKACKRVEDAGLKVAACLAILDREEGGTGNIQEAGYPFLSIYTRSSLKRYAAIYERSWRKELKSDMARIARNANYGAMGGSPCHMSEN